MRAGAVENSPLWYGDRTREDYGVLEVGTEAQSTRAVEWSRARKGEEVSSRARKKAVVGWNRGPLACALREGEQLVVARCGRGINLE